MTSHMSHRIMVFCTGYSGDLVSWEQRYARWLRGVELAIRADVTVIIDDGSPVLPDWPTIPVYGGLDSLGPSSRFIYHFQDNLGRPDVLDYPGWFRSFTFASELAEALGCDRIIHLESDAFVLSRRFADYVETSAGWTCPISTRGRTPESGIQAIAPDAQRLFREFSRLSYDNFRGMVVERLIPYTAETTAFTGDRYGETSLVVPWEADWTMQTPQQAYAPERGYRPGFGWDLLDIGYFWFLRPERTGDLAYNPRLRARWTKHGREFVTDAGGKGNVVTDTSNPFWTGVSPRGVVVGPSVDADACARRLMTQATLDLQPHDETGSPAPERLLLHEAFPEEAGMNATGSNLPIKADIAIAGSQVSSGKATGLDVVSKDASKYLCLTDRHLLDQLASRYFLEYAPYYRGDLTSVTWKAEAFSGVSKDGTTCCITLKRAPRDPVIKDTLLWIVRDAVGDWDARYRWSGKGALARGPDLRPVIDLLLTNDHLRAATTQCRQTGHFGMPLADEYDESYPVNMFVD